MRHLGENNDFLPQEVKDWFKMLGEDARLIGNHRRKLFDTEAFGKLSPSIKQKYPLCLDPFYSTIVSNRMRDIVREWWNENAIHIERNAFAMVRPGKRLVAFEGVLAPYAAVWRDVELAYAELTENSQVVLDSPSTESTAGLTTGAKSSGFEQASPESEELREKLNPFLTRVSIALVAFGTIWILWRARKVRASRN